MLVFHSRSSVDTFISLFLGKFSILWFIFCVLWFIFCVLQLGKARLDTIDTTKSIFKRGISSQSTSSQTNTTTTKSKGNSFSRNRIIETCQKTRFYWSQYSTTEWTKTNSTIKQRQQQTARKQQPEISVCTRRNIPPRRKCETNRQFSSKRNKKSD